MKKSSVILIFAAIMLSMILTSCGDDVTNNLAATYSVPSVPLNINAVSADSRVTITFSPVLGATSYNIYWKTSSGVTTSDSVIVSDSSPYIHLNLTNGTPYYYAVTAVNIQGESPLSQEVSSTPSFTGTVPETPSNVTALPANGQVSLDWTPVEGAEYYKIYWATEPGVDTSHSKIITNLFPFVHESLSQSTTYYYRISAVNSVGESDLSTEISMRARTPFSGMIQSLTAFDAQTNDNFGMSVAVSGDYVIVGAMNEDDGGLSNSGAVYIFHRTGPDAWDTGIKLKSPSPHSSELFGCSVSISGDFAVVGARGNNSLGVSSGAAYIFNRTGPNTWDAGTKISASDAQIGDLFGFSVSINGDYVVVGATSEDGGTGNPYVDAGAAYIFHRTGTATWDGGIKLSTPDIQASSAFGYSVAINGDYAVVSSPWKSDGFITQGTAYAFHRTGTNIWDSGTVITATDPGANDWFGISVSINGDYIAVGAPGEDGGLGSPYSNSGAAYIFHRTGTNSWDNGIKITAPDGQSADYFGSSLALSGDYLAVGAYLEKNGPGDPLVDSGSAYIFQRTWLNSWDSGSRISAPDAQTGDEFAYSVAIGNGYMVAGAGKKNAGGVAGAGKIYIF